MPPGSGLPAEEVLASLERLADVSLSYMSLEQMLSELLERISAILHTDTAAILLLDPDRKLLLARAARGIEEEVRQGVQIPLGRGFAGRIAAERRPIAIEDVDHSYVLNPLLRQRGIRSLLGVPLLVHGEVIGVLHVGTLTPRHFTEEDGRLLELAAGRAALAIDNARLAEQRALTHLMQRTLLPEALPEIPGLRLSAKYRPAESGIKVGGDWYDVFTLPTGQIAFVIGDIVGRGMIAAAVMAEIRAACRAYAVERHGPGEVMTLLNALVRSLGRNRSATAAIFMLDIEAETLVGSSAGHLPAILRRPDGSCELFAAASGPPLGTRAASQYDEEVRELPRGGALVLFTDGLIERRGESIGEGLDRLVGVIGEHGAVSAPIFVPEGVRPLSLADRVFEHIPPAPDGEDDIALLAIESLLVGDHVSLALDASPTVLAGLRRAVAHWLKGHGVADEERFDITLACSEAAGNAIVHAYGLRPASFQLDCSYDAGDVAITVQDTGTWRTPGGRAAGRGLMIMRELMDSVEIDSGEHGTTVHLRKRVIPA